MMATGYHIPLKVGMVDVSQFMEQVRNVCLDPQRTIPESQSTPFGTVPHVLGCFLQSDRLLLKSSVKNPKGVFEQKLVISQCSVGKSCGFPVRWASNGLYHIMKG